jgi:hypothetical protein
MKGVLKTLTVVPTTVVAETTKSTFRTEFQIQGPPTSWPFQLPSYLGAINSRYTPTEQCSTRETQGVEREGGPRSISDHDSAERHADNAPNVTRA